MFEAVSNTNDKNCPRVPMALAKNLLNISFFIMNVSTLQMSLITPKYLKLAQLTKAHQIMCLCKELVKCVLTMQCSSTRESEIRHKKMLGISRR